MSDVRLTSVVMLQSWFCYCSYSATSETLHELNSHISTGSVCREWRIRLDWCFAKCCMPSGKQLAHQEILVTHLQSLIICEL